MLEREQLTCAYNLTSFFLYVSNKVITKLKMNSKWVKKLLIIRFGSRNMLVQGQEPMAREPDTALLMTDVALWLTENS